MLVPQVARKLALAEVGRPEPPLFTGSLEPKRDYVDVRDVAGAYVRWLSSGISGVHFVNICSGASTSGLDVVRALCVLFGQPAPDAAGLPRAEAGAVMDLTGDGRAALESGMGAGGLEDDQVGDGEDHHGNHRHHQHIPLDHGKVALENGRQAELGHPAAFLSLLSLSLLCVVFELAASMFLAKGRRAIESEAPA